MPHYKKDDYVVLKTNDFAKILKVVHEAVADDDWQYEASLSTREKKTISGKDIQSSTLRHLYLRKFHQLDDFESDTLDKYTGPTFKEWNTILRTGKGETPEIAALQRVITKAPKYTGPVFRGLSFKDEPERDKYLSYFTGNTYTTPQFMSTSKSNAAALGFAVGNFSVFMRIYGGGGTGAILRSFTGNKDLGEDEVLFLHGARFLVKENRKVDVSANQGSWYLGLCEEGCAEPQSLLVIPAFKTKNTL